MKSDTLRLVPLPGMTETQLRRLCVDALRWRGAMVLEMGQWKMRCRKCGEYSSGGYGNTPGTPDLAVRLPGMQLATWVLIELKRGSKAAVRPEQQALADAGGSIIAATWEDVAAALGLQP